MIEAKLDALDLADLDAAVSSRASQASVDVLEAKADVIAAQLDDTITSRASQTAVDDLNAQNLAIEQAIAALTGDVQVLPTKAEVEGEFADVDQLFADTRQALQEAIDAIDTRSTQSSLDDMRAFLEATGDVLDAVAAEVDAPVSSRASQTSVDDLNAQNVAIEQAIATLTGNVQVLPTQTELEAEFADVDQLLADAQQALESAINTRSDQDTVNTVQSTVEGIESAVAALETKLDLNSITSLDAQGSINDIAAALTASLDAPVTTRATQASVDVIEAKADVMEAKLDALETTIATAINEAKDQITQAVADEAQDTRDTVNDRADAIDGAVAGLDGAVAALEAKADGAGAILDELAAGGSGVHVTVVEVKKNERYLVSASLAGERTDVSLVSVFALEMKSKKPAVSTDLSSATATTQIGTGLLDVKLSLPKKAKKLDIIIFDVEDTSGNAGTVVFSRLEDDD